MQGGCSILGCSIEEADALGLEANCRSPALKIRQWLLVMTGPGQGGRGVHGLQ